MPEHLRVLPLVAGSSAQLGAVAHDPGRAACAGVLGVCPTALARGGCGLTRETSSGAVPEGGVFERRVDEANAVLGESRLYDDVASA
jgi:hypothetical protein